MSHQEQEVPFPRQPRKVPPSPPPSPEEELQRLNQEVLRVQAGQLRDLLSNPGWGVLSKIVEDIMKEAAVEADTAEGAAVYRAQGKKAALRELNLRVNDFVAVLREEEKNGEES
jgi:hypothetical protein